MSTYLPKARTEGVLSQETFEDLVLVDQRHNTAHSLNQTAALVYKHADGTRSVDDLVDVLRSHVGDSADADLVELTIQELSRADLLVERPAARPAQGSRRRFLQKVAMMGTLAAVLPVVESIASPTRDDSRSPTRKDDKKKKDGKKDDKKKKKDDDDRRRRRRRRR